MGFGVWQGNYIPSFNKKILMKDLQEISRAIFIVAVVILLCASNQMTKNLPRLQERNIFLLKD